MRRILLALALLALALAGGAAGRYLRTALPIGAGFAAKLACSFAFVGGQDPEDVFARYIAPEIAPLGPALSLEVDRPGETVRASVLGLVRRTAIHRPGLGCTLLVHESAASLRAATPPDPRPAALARHRATSGPWPLGRGQPPTVGPPAVEAALDRAFAEPGGPLRQTTAVVIAHGGRLVAERYAPGFGPETPMLSWSMAKSVTGALLGIAVAEGRLALRAPVPVSAWHGAGDRRGAISLDQLLRMSSGLAFEERYTPGDDVTRMLYLAPDMGAYAAARPLAAGPDARWSYSSGTTNLLARVLREAVGGDLGNAWEFAFSRLFAPLGMESAVMEPDESGSFVGSSYVFASARDWARFGQLFLQDGVWNGARILPQGWVAYSTTPTPAASDGRYGAHWWLNAGAPDDPARRPWPGLPRDAASAQGHSGQYLLIVPSQALVVVRLGLSHREADHGIEALAREVLDALRDGG